MNRIPNGNHRVCGITWRLTVVWPLIIAVQGGCGLASVIGRAVGAEEKRVKVDAEYRCLEGKTVAVLVNADQYTFYEHPGAQQAITRAVSANLRARLVDAKLTDPDQLVKWQESHPYWNTIRYSRLVNTINVEVIILIDLAQYTTHELGNEYQLRGTILATVSVIEASREGDLADTNDNFSYSRTVRSQFPQDNPVGMLDSDEQTVELGMLANFADKVAGLFYDHKETVK